MMILEKVDLHKSMISPKFSIDISKYKPAGKDSIARWL